MKRITILIALLLVFNFASFAKAPVAKGKTNCCLGNYVIEKATDPIIVDGKALRSFVVSYENSDMTIIIGIDRSDKNCRKFIVVSDDLAVQYDCNGKYFGVKQVEDQYLDDGYITSDLAIDRSAYFHQKVITREPYSNIDHMRLISVYFPKLVKDYETVFAVK